VFTAAPANVKNTVPIRYGGPASESGEDKGVIFFHGPPVKDCWDRFLEAERLQCSSNLASTANMLEQQEKVHTVIT
jgi:hypothetical protein